MLLRLRSKGVLLLDIIKESIGPESRFRDYNLLLIYDMHVSWYLTIFVMCLSCNILFVYLIISI